MNRISTAPLTPAQILARLLLVDGTGSGLDADFVRGLAPDNSILSGSIGGVTLFGQIPTQRARVVYPDSLFRI